MKLYLIIFLSFSIIFPTIILAENEIKVLGRQSKEDISYDYHYELIELAVQKSRDKYPNTSLKTIDVSSASHRRNIQLLMQNKVDLYWAGTNPKREEEFIPIRIPLALGLLGYRVMIIHKDNLAIFNQIKKSPEKLKKLTACQGMFWPDSDILEDNGYKVQRVARFNLMFKMVARNRCQYFPRAISEGYAELSVANKEFPELVIFDDIILHYKFPMYLFVNKHNTELAAQLRYGLKKASEDGSMLEFVTNHALTRDLFPLTQWQDKRFIPLHNKYLSKETPLNNKNLWIELTH